MPQHFTRATVSASAWCPRHERQTMHRVDDRRIGPCLECLQDAQILKERYEERAALKEFCGNLPREQAESEAKKEIYSSGVRK